MNVVIGRTDMAMVNFKPASPLSNFLTDLLLENGPQKVEPAAVCDFAMLNFGGIRAQLPEGKVSLKELLLLGLGIGVVSAVVYGLWTWLNCGSLHTDMVSYYNQQRIAVMDAADSSAEAKVAIEQVGRYTAGDWGFIAAFRSAVMSVIIAFFAAIIFRTEKSPVRN